MLTMYSINKLRLTIYFVYFDFGGSGIKSAICYIKEVVIGGAEIT